MIKLTLKQLTITAGCQADMSKQSVLHNVHQSFPDQLQMQPLLGFVSTLHCFVQRPATIPNGDCACGDTVSSV